MLQQPDHANPKIIEVTFSFPEFVTVCKKSFYSTISFLRNTDTFQCGDQTGHTDFEQTHTQILNKLLIFVDFFQHAKNQDILSICSGDIVDLKILKSDRLRVFWPNLMNQIFPRNEIRAGTEQIIQIFIIKQFSNY